MNPLLAIGAVLALMVLAVLATMVIENWRHLVTPAPIRRLAQRDNDGYGSILDVGVQMSF